MTSSGDARLTEPTWTPDPQDAAETAMAAFLRAIEQRTGRAKPSSLDAHAWSLADPGAFWSLVWEFFGVVGDAGGVAHVRTTMPEAVFFPEARLNLAENLLAPWWGVDAPAVIWTGEIADGLAVREEVSGRELCRRVAAFAAWLREHGIAAGDRVGLILPVGPDALVCTLGALAVGGIVTSVSPEFGAPSILDRLGQLEPRVLVVAPSYRWGGRDFHRSDNLREVIDALPSVAHVLVAGESPADLGTSLASVLEAEAPLAFDALPFDHPAYVLFSSGTTGRPKCLVHRAGGVLLKHLVEVGLHADVRRGDRLLFYTMTSWMMWNWEISALALGATLVLHDGAPTHPDAAALVDCARMSEATHLGTGARLLDHMRSEDVDLATHLGDRAVLRQVMVTGSPLSVATAQWLAGQCGPRVMIHPISGGTDLVGVLVGGDPTRAFRAGEMTGPALGMAVDVFTDAGERAADGEPGELVCLQPFPTVPVGIWGDESGERLASTYFHTWPGVWVHGDRAVRTEHGGFVILGRSDATLNVGGVRIGTAEIYAALAEHPAVVDSLAFGQEWAGDTRIVLLVVLAPGVTLDDDVVASIRAQVRAHCSPRHVPAVVLAVADLPRTQTGKLSEVAVRDAVHGRPVAGRAALVNPECLEPIVAAMARVT